LRLVQVYGISPGAALRLEKANVYTVSDLASNVRLADLSISSQIPSATLRQWQSWASLKAVVARRRRKAITALWVFIAVSVGMIAIWFLEERPSPRLDKAIAYYNRGNAASRQGDYNSAVGEYEQAISERPKYAEAYNNMAFALHQNGDLNAAISGYRRASALNPEFALAHYNLGNVLREKEGPDAAIPEYQKALVLNPKLFQAHNNLGAVLAERGELGEAIAEFQKSLVLNPECAPANFNLGAALEAKGDRRRYACGSEGSRPASQFPRGPSCFGASPICKRAV